MTTATSKSDQKDPVAHELPQRKIIELKPPYNKFTILAVLNILEEQNAGESFNNRIHLETTDGPAVFRAMEELVKDGLVEKDYDEDTEEVTYCLVKKDDK